MKLTVGRKISLLWMGLAGLTAILGGVAIYTATTVGEAVGRIAGESLPRLHDAATLRGNTDELRALCLMHIAAIDSGQKQSLEIKIRDAETALAGTVLKIEQHAEAGDEAARVSDLLERYRSAWSRVLPASRSGKHDEAFAQFLAEAHGPYSALLSATNNLLEVNRKASEQRAHEAAAFSRQSARFAWIVLIGAVLAGAVCAYVVVRGMRGALQRTVGELLEGAEQLASAAGQISASSQSLAQGAAEQSASLEETSASAQEIRALSHGNTERVADVVTLMQNSENVAAEANQALIGMTASMGEINNSSQSISRIIKVIDEIAFQTNILALNAAVEAARAGEAGMGFAVVADEVRSLAQRCAQAAKDTSKLIEESIFRSREGATKLGHVAKAISANSEFAGKVNSLAGEVNEGSVQQTRGIEQIAAAISEMESVVQRTAASAEESASSAQQLTAQAENLRCIVKELGALV